MASIVTTIPQNVVPVNVITLKQLLAVLPDNLDYPLNVWIGGKLSDYGQTTDNLVFLVEQSDEPSNEMMSYFNAFVEPFGLAATASNLWKNNQIDKLRLYNQGTLIIDRTTLAFTQAPNETIDVPILTLDDFLSKLEQTISFTQKIWLTGSLVKNGFSNNDADVMVGDFDPDTQTFTPVDKQILVQIRNYFSTLIGWRVDAGQKLMPERGDIYLYKLYEGGSLCPR